MSTATRPQQDPAQVLAKALLNAGKDLGLSQTDISRIVSRDRSTIQRNGLDPESASGQLALLLIRCYRSLYALMGGDREQMQHWMHTRNQHLDGVPAERLYAVSGLVHVCDYLDAIRGKV